MKEIYMHYGVEVICQQVLDKTFRGALKENNVEYTDLPIMDSDVITYIRNDTRYYACIVAGNSPDTYVENVYLTTAIPLDLSWGNLVKDCNGQHDGEEPMRMKTKAKMICELAEKMALDNLGNANVFIPAEITPVDFKASLAHLGYTLDDIMVMDHDDVDNNFLQFLMN